MATGSDLQAHDVPSPSSRCASDRGARLRANQTRPVPGDLISNPGAAWS